MENKIDKYLAENKQIRIYILSGEQIYCDTEALKIDNNTKIILRKALNITAFENVINSKWQRISYVFLSKNGKSKLSTESFSNNTITGMISLDKDDSNFYGGTLKTIYVPDNQYDVSRTSNLLLNDENIYKNMEKFYDESEQTPTYLIPLLENQNNIVCLVQPLPFADKNIINKVLNQINSIKSKIENAEMIEELFSSEINDLDYLETVNVKYSCGCSRDMFLKILRSLSGELDKNAFEDEKIEVSCSMCGKKYVFNVWEI